MSADVVPERFGTLTTFRERLWKQGAQHFVWVDRVRLSYIDAGPRKAQGVLLLHGLGGSAYDWRALIPKFLKAGYRTIAMEMKGAGLSEKPPSGPYSIAAQARLAVSFCRKLGLRRLIVMGNSLGGALGLWMALRAPDRVRGLVLLDPVCYRQPIPQFLRLVRMRLLAEVLIWVVPVRPVVRSILEACYYDHRRLRTQVVDDYTLDALRVGRRSALLAGIRDLMPAEREIRRFEKGIRGIRKPTLIVWGDHDDVVPTAFARRMHDDIRGSRLVIIPNCGHTPNQERPDVLWRRMAEFLAEFPPDGRSARSPRRRRRRIG